ncbi:hypothetical protein GOV06_03490 [Candidatus Woesearchaeota archaeon]|nr:hypothetical protein [Candidatus Woesearchaeota archaeon]
MVAENEKQADYFCAVKITQRFNSKSRDEPQPRKHYECWIGNHQESCDSTKNIARILKEKLSIHDHDNNPADYLYNVVRLYPSLEGEKALTFLQATRNDVEIMGPIQNLDELVEIKDHLVEMVRSEGFESKPSQGGTMLDPPYA